MLPENEEGRPWARAASRVDISGLDTTTVRHHSAGSSSISAHEAAVIAALGRAATTKRAECADRRHRVLEYVDLRNRLCAPPLSFRRPEDWSGFIPPAETGEGTLNTSPRRRVLVEISAEALRREREEQGAGT